ncbi:Phospholipase A2 [Gryllus bimaculatus]|nr:Phospholipase A2 [Gryllus bimaculatus]
MNGISGMLCTAPRFCCFSAAPAAAATSAAAAAAASSRHTDSVASTGGHALTNLNINCTSPNSKALFDSWFKRGISENFIVPGTKWCGPHQTATRYGELGPLSLMDRCCRRHDNCKTNIPAFTNKYNMFNLRPFTISHCHCDTRFRTCLKMTNTAAANLVGKLFFNVVQTKCFVLKPRKVCLRMSWWGKCEKYGVRKQAHLRNNVPY